MAAQQPAQRKHPAKQAKILQSLRNIQTEQALRLQQKYQFQQELLEEIRSYAKQRSTIEKEYAQALQKLDTQFQKRDFSSDDTSDSHRTPLGVWKMVLDESENISKQRLDIAEALQTQIADNIKTVKANKTQDFKKCQEVLQKIHEEVFTTVREMSKAKKGYLELEKLAQVAREQAAEAEDKYKKKNVKFFQSKGTLEKNVSKSSSRKEISEKRSTMGRNEYLLCLAASNAHMMRYYCTDLQEIMNNVYGDFYEKVKEYFSIISKLGVDASTSEQKGFGNVGSQAAMIDRDFCVECFLSKNKVFTEVIRYDFDPWKHDKISKIITDKTAGLALNKEARKLAMRLTREQRNLKEKQKALSTLMSSNQSDEASVPCEGDQENQEQNVETLKEEIRHSEVIKLKSEACLDILREAGVNVEEWMKSANSLSPTDGETDKGLGGSMNSLSSGTAEEQSGWEDEWDVDDTFTGDYSSDDDTTSVTSTGSLPMLCVALYNFEATTEEELSITEHEELEILERDGEGWYKGRNKTGQVGFFPESYVEVRTKERSLSTHSSSHSGSITSSLGGSPVVVPKAAEPQEKPYLCLVKALYDYESMSEEELTFNEGDIIHVTKKDDNGVDDGFWEGFINGRSGVFPNLVVEAIEGSEPSEPIPSEPEITAPQTEQTHAETYSPQIKQTHNSLTPTKTQKYDDYIDIPDTYTTVGKAPPLLTPARRAPPPPKDSPRIARRGDSAASTNVDPTDRHRAKTENITSMRKPEGGASFNRSVSSYESPPSVRSSKHDYDDVYDEYASPTASNTGDYVNTKDLPMAGPDNRPSRDTNVKAKPPLPPPPSTSSRRAFKSHSYV